jgi:allophanate hydrolase
VNLLDLAAISVPVGMRSDGLPSSLTLISRAGTDGFLASVAATLHGETTAGPLRATSPRIEIAVMGAHLSGLPLNHELTGAGGILLRAVETTPDYKLYALPDTVPAKPGLLRVRSGQGSAIAAEVWSLEPAAFGAFVARIPAPLGIGTLRFTDGTEAKGFLVEAEAVREARDISKFGGWVNYLKAGSTAQAAE